MSRKTPTFNQLFDYMEKGSIDSTFILTHNLKLARGSTRENVLEQFYDNASFLRRSEKQNYLYHEIISLKITRAIDEKRLKRIMFELGKMYLHERAKENLAYGRIHLEPSEDFTNIHVHLMISSNGLESTKRHRLDKNQFHTIQKQLEAYILERYPELEQQKVYDKSFEKVRVDEKEYQLKQRTGKKTQREQVRELLLFIFQQVQTKEELLNYCEKYHISFYQRGQYAGISINGKKYRLHKLELVEEYKRLWQRLQQLEVMKDFQQENITHQEEPTYESKFVRKRMEYLKKIQNQQEQLPEQVKNRLKELQKLREQSNYTKEHEKD